MSFPIKIKSKTLDINAVTFQPLMTVTLDLTVTLENLQDHGAGNSVHFPPEAYEQLARDIFTAIVKSHDIPVVKTT